MNTAVTLLTGGGLAAFAVVVVALLNKGKNDAEKTNTNVKTASDVVVLVNSQLDREVDRRKKAETRGDRQHVNIARLRDYVDLLVAILRRHNIPEPTAPVLLKVDDE